MKTYRANIDAAVDLGGPRREIEFLVRASCPADLSNAAAGRELRHLINDGTGWLWSAGEAIKVTKVTLTRRQPSLDPAKAFLARGERRPL